MIDIIFKCFVKKKLLLKLLINKTKNDQLNLKANF